MKKKYGLKRIISALCLRASTHLPVNNRVRVYLAAWGGKNNQQEKMFYWRWSYL